MVEGIIVCYKTVHYSPNQQGPANPWIGCALGLPNLNLDNVSHNHQKSTNPWISWVSGVVFVVTDHIQG
jgi:hypothetical protein